MKHYGGNTIFFFCKISRLLPTWYQSKVWILATNPKKIPIVSHTVYDVSKDPSLYGCARRDERQAEDWIGLNQTGDILTPNKG